ncbi:SAM-dependent methyltransferase [Nocardia sp. NBC_00508]|uniref:SAM-dependent methyltransferase n=1 Tax=Nocardia sp. NBC_00508 TaxID=2975992 RepID=UPI002E7FDE1C|nr:SAM-dependent methyltransferase [Nocardia sp. NBC_00508]WUD65706.1 SAM-dependent methyltransferase [Nocardia sp. NBC_00508]
MTEASNPIIRTDIPHSARIWNYWMGGKDNYEVDRIVGEQSIEIYPDIRTMAVQSRQFLIRTVGFLARDAGVRQFLDIGTGLPTMQNTHQVAQAIIPAARVVYVDNDPLVLAHARALLTSSTPEGVTTYIDADAHKPETIISDAGAVLNFEEPIGVMFMGVLGHADSHEDMIRIVRTVMAAMPSGSYLTLWDSSDENEQLVRLCDEYAKTGAVPYYPRPAAQIHSAFEGLELVEPGFVDITDWRAEPPDIGVATSVYSYGAVARKP